MQKDNRKKMNVTKILLVLAVTTLIFITGIFFGNLIANKKLSIINNMQQDLRTDISSVELQYLLLAENPCSALNYTPLTDELYKIATRLDYMENSLGEDDENVMRLKNYYSTLQIKHWLLVKKMKEQCDSNITTVLYFYDTKKNCAKCEQQGFILTYLRKKFPDVYVYAFYINLDNPAVKTIKTMYSITTTPSVVIDGKKFEGFQSRNQLLEYISCRNDEECSLED